MNLTFSQSGKDFAASDPTLHSTHLRGVGREADSERWGKKSLSTSAFSSSVAASLPAVFIGAVQFLWPSFSG